MNRSQQPFKNLKQKGAALVVFFMAIILSGAVFLISDLGPDFLRVNSANKTSASLAKAKEALLSHAVSYYFGQSNLSIPHHGYHGLLPCPERPDAHFNEGISSGSCGGTHTNSLGRLPWKTLNIEPLKDSSGECLWYAVSGGFYNNPRSPMTNDDTPGMFQIFNENGFIYKGNTPEDRVVAVIIAPGTPLTNQTRNSSAQNPPLPCKVPGDSVTPSDYLDNFQGINNAQVTNTSDDEIDQFINSNGLGKNTSLNDRILTITASEIFNIIKDNNNMYSEKINTLADDISDCLVLYATETNTTITSGGSSGGGSTPPPPCIDTCNTSCDTDRTLCMLSANTGPQRAACNQTRRDCRRDCRSSCGSGAGSGGTTNTAFLFPWPALIDVGDDFRFNNNYSDQLNLVNSVGRLPFNTTNSSTTLTNIFSAGGCSLSSTVDNEYRNLWDSWKDHWFFIVNEDFQPGSAPAAQDSSTCSGTSCLMVNGNSYAAALIFSGERLSNPPFNQLRQDPYIETGTNVGDLKTELNNYLEGSNNTGGTSLGDYTGLPAQVNDRIYCFSVDSTSVSTSYVIDPNTRLPVCN